MDPVGDGDSGAPLHFSTFPGSEPPVEPKEEQQQPKREQTPAATPERKQTPSATPEREQSPPPTPEQRAATPSVHNEPHTPQQSPEQQTACSKRQLTSPASDLSSPEHVRVKRPPPVPPRPKAPEFTAQPMSDFKPVPAATGYGRFKNLPHWHVPRERSDEPGPSHSFNFPPEQQQQ